MVNIYPLVDGIITVRARLLSKLFTIL